MFDIDFSKEIANYYQHLFTLIPKARHVILHSGRATTKSTFFCMLDLVRLYYYDNADGLVIVYEYDSIEGSILRDYKTAAEILKLPTQNITFYSTKNGQTWIKVKNRYGRINNIFFEHAKKGAEGFKGMRPEKGHRWLFIRWYELTNFINWNSDEVINTNSTFVRNCYKTIRWDKVEEYCTKHNIFIEKKTENWLNSQAWYRKDWSSFITREFCIEYEFNTPGADQAKGGWVMEWLATFKQRADVWYQFNNYEDMTPEEQYHFLGPEGLDEIEQTKISNPIEWAHVYKGKSAYDGDIVFPMLSRNTHFGKFENFKPDLLVIGVDVGRSDATVVTLNGFEYKYKDLRIALGIHRWSHCNRRCEYIKDGIKLPYKSWDINQYANMILEFCDMVHQEFPWARIYFQMDREGAGTDFYDACFRFRPPLYLDVNRLWKKMPPGIRIDTLQTAFTVPGIVKIYDPVTFNAYQNQIYDQRKREKDGERKRLEDPTRPGIDMDSQDSCEYGILPWFFDIIKERIMKDKGKFCPEKHQSIF